MIKETKRLAWREHTCRTCAKTFKASRIDANFCSGRCRMYWCKHGAPYPAVLIARAEIDARLYPVNLTTLTGLPRDDGTAVTVPRIDSDVDVAPNSKMDEVVQLEKKGLLNVIETLAKIGNGTADVKNVLTSQVSPKSRKVIAKKKPQLCKKPAVKPVKKKPQKIRTETQTKPKRKVKHVPKVKR